MRLLHISDLHLGKKVNGFSMEEEQQHVLDQIIELLKSRKDTSEAIDHLVIAGDVYDKGIPPVTAVTMFDEFLTSLSKLNIHTYIISGNHDSAERLSFGSRLFEANNIHMVAGFDGQIPCINTRDEFGDINIYMLPYIRPVDVRRMFDIEVSSYEEAFEALMERNPIDTSVRNILIAHQNINGAEKSDSEDIFIGGLDGISASLFKDFDYVALGHLHKNQKIGSDKIRYAGSPVKYSFSEAKYNKALNIVELGEKGDMSVDKFPLKQIHDMRLVEGLFDDIIQNQIDSDQDLEDYVHVILKDETEHIDVMRKLRDRYPNIMAVSYDNRRTQNMHTVYEMDFVAKRTPMEYVEEFFRCTNGQAMSEEQRELMNTLITKIWEEEA